MPIFLFAENNGCGGIRVVSGISKVQDAARLYPTDLGELWKLRAGEFLNDGRKLIVRTSPERYDLRRMWINQPSTHQQWHHLHGTNVLAGEPDGQFCTIWFLSGDTHSSFISNIALSNGWI